MTDLRANLDVRTANAAAGIRRVQRAAERTLNATLNVTADDLAAIEGRFSALEIPRESTLLVASNLDEVAVEQAALEQTLNTSLLVASNLDEVAVEQAALERTLNSTLLVASNLDEVAVEQAALERTLNSTLSGGGGDTQGGGGSAFGLVTGAAGGLAAGIPGGGLLVAGALPFGGLAAGLIAVTNAASETDTALREVASLQIPGFGLEEARATIEAFNEETGLGIRENIPGLYQALSAGVPPDNILDFLIQSGELASAGVAELQPTIGVLSGALNAYGEEALNAEDASNALFGAVQSGVTTLPELAASLGEVTPLAADLGITFTELNAAVATSTQVTGRTTTTVTGLRSILAELGTSVSVAGRNFEEAAGVGFRQFIDEGGTLQEGLQLLVTQADDLDLGLNELFGSIEAGGVALQLTREDGQAFADTIESMTGIVEDGTAVSNAFEINQASLAATLSRLGAGVEGLAVRIGTGLLPVFTRVAETVETSVIPAVGSFIDIVVSGRSAIENIQREAAGLGGLDFSDPFIKANTDISDFATVTGEAMTPLQDIALFVNGTMIPGIINLGGSIRDVAVNAWQEFSDFTLNVALPAAQEIAGFITTEFGPILGGLGDDIGGEDGVVGGLNSLVDTIFDDALPALTDLAVEFAEDVIPQISEVAAVIVDDVVPSLLDLAAEFNELRPDIETILTVIGDLIEFSGDLAVVWSTVMGPAFSAVGGIIGDVSSALSTLNDLISAVPSLPTGSIGAGIGLIGDLPFVGANELGSVIRSPQITWVGEGYKPEVIAPITDIPRTVDLFTQAGVLAQLRNEILSRQPATGTGGVLSALPSVTQNNYVTMAVPSTMNPEAALREWRRQTRRAAEAAAAKAFNTAVAA